MSKALNRKRLGNSCDVLVIGSGAGALAAAVTAVDAGLSVIVVEKTALIGGATARSGGWVWIPNNTQARERGATDSAEAAMAYIRSRGGECFDAARAAAFVQHGDEMLDFMARSADVHWRAKEWPDYYPNEPGAAVAYRSMSPQPFDGRRLGSALAGLRPPLRTGTFLGMQIDGDDFDYFFTAGRSLKSFCVVAGRTLQLFKDLLVHGRTMRLTGGNALIGGLLNAALSKAVDVRCSVAARSLVKRNGRVVGANVSQAGVETFIEARCGVVLATGGFGHDTRRRNQVSPHGMSSAEAWAALPDGNCGDGIRMAEEVGAVFETRMPMPIALTPFSRLHSGEGVMETFPVHTIRGAPGVISVTQAGDRFTNEACNYHQYGLDLLRACPDDPAPHAWFIADHRALRRFGLGYVLPFPIPIGRHLRSGYLKRGRTLAELAEQTGIGATRLATTVARFNDNARKGVDPQFNRGSDAYDRVQGDPAHEPNPCLGPLEQPPYYAIEVFTGALSTFAGLLTDADARVLSTSGAPIDGLYAAGLDMSSIAGGDYIAGGINIGPAMTFGFLAARHMCASRDPGAENSTSCNRQHSYG